MFWAHRCFQGAHLHAQHQVPLSVSTSFGCQEVDVSSGCHMMAVGCCRSCRELASKVSSRPCSPPGWTRRPTQKNLRRTTTLGHAAVGNKTAPGAPPRRTL
eukprot:3383017-Amphidinium_carterae.1